MLKENEQKILYFLKEQIKENGYPPSVREICAAVGLKSTSSVHLYLTRLAEKGYIAKKDLKTRAIKIVDNEESSDEKDVNLFSIPLVGNVAAGAPILAEENIEDYFKLPANFIPKAALNGKTYMLKVKGESMINVGIHDGDYIIVLKQNTATNGEIVVAMIENEATVKTFYKEKTHVRLQPENDFMEPIIIKDVQILGKVVGLFRKY
ncbi:MAG: transcriptional repressor LexA [Clostridia bacterium]|nr:transcriptional repressor LexA [Clostridia bacterium]MDD4376063.1 transcriptional repressor LexA [Clostridia bacterium]